MLRSPDEIAAVLAMMSVRMRAPAPEWPGTVAVFRAGNIEAKPLGNDELLRLLHEAPKPTHVDVLWNGVGLQLSLMPGEFALRLPLIGLPPELFDSADTTRDVLVLAANMYVAVSGQDAEAYHRNYPLLPLPVFCWDPPDGDFVRGLGVPEGLLAGVRMLALCAGPSSGASIHAPLRRTGVDWSAG